MSGGESYWIERAQSAEAKLATCQGSQDRLKEEARTVMETLCARKKGDGSFVIDFAALAARLPLDQALDLRAAIDEAHRITGAAGEKPRVKVAAAS